MERLAALVVVLALCCADAAAAAAQSVTELATAEATLAFDRRDRRSVQAALQELGFDPGPADGIFGPQTRVAIRRYQERGSEEPTGFLTYAQARELLAISDPLYEPGDTFRDCDDCPEMVVVPSGSFLMGSPEGEEAREDIEGPQHRVTIAEPFAIGVYEVTFNEWDACVADGGCNGYLPDDEGWGRGRRPVINVSWENAQAYLDWLSSSTGMAYRLPSEAEWEYAARAGTTTPFHFGPTISTDQANHNGTDTYGSGQKGVRRGQTVQVGSFPANAFGLHDVHGNVWEWIEDCWNDRYAGAPANGTAWTSGYCGQRVLRGGSWYNDSGDLRSANRYANYTNTLFFSDGFRVARKLR